MIVGIVLNEIGKCTYKMSVCVWGGGGGAEQVLAMLKGGGGVQKVWDLQFSHFVSPPHKHMP